MIPYYADESVRLGRTWASPESAARRLSQGVLDFGEGA